MVIFITMMLQPGFAVGLNTLYKFKAGAFPIVSHNSATTILIDSKDAEVVNLTANAVAGDIALITGKKPEIITNVTDSKADLIIAGTIGQSAFVDQLIKSAKLDVSGTKGKWETYTISIIESPLKGVKRALVIAGSDRRGTAYGLFELSRRLGVSPWVWWADVLPETHKQLYLTPGTICSKEPAVKYRGIFINDEDWGLHPWAAKNMDIDIKDIGPKTYAKVFELLLRLRANTIWPAMHDSTKAFFYYPQNPVVADKYAIVMGSTHCDQMLRSNTFEWQKNFEHEYGKMPGEYRYDKNKAEVHKYWEDRVKAVKDYESVFTIGMRGVRDGSIVGPTTPKEKILLLDTIMSDQRGMFRKYYGDEKNVAQIFCPYKEVLSLYKSGLKIPDDVTLVWTDDNYGYIRQLSNPVEQKRSGGSGIYYHLEYLGKPHDYAWLSSNSPALISFEMTKAYQFGANRFWMVNVGDIKPAEMELQFFLDMAFEPERWTPDKANGYAKHWAEQNFGSELATQIADLKQQYYALAQAGKPEHMGLLRFDPVDRAIRLKEYHDLFNKADRLKKQIPLRLRDAFFELVEYPVKSASLMNQKVIYAQMSKEVAAKHKRAPLIYSQMAYDAFKQIKTLTATYNNDIASGKWSGIITYMPRNLAVYAMPGVAVPEVISPADGHTGKFDRRYLDTVLVKPEFHPNSIQIKATAYSRIMNQNNDSIVNLPDLGAGSKSIARYPFTGACFIPENYRKAPQVEYDVPLKPGEYDIILKCLPTQPIHAGRGLGLAIVVNDNDPIFVDMNQSKGERQWMTNIIRGYAGVTVPANIRQHTKSKIRIYLLDTGLALNSLAFKRKE
ncbi:MAG: glycosyl hydrolase 115 family protein [Paludibacter sp.]